MQFEVALTIFRSGHQKEEQVNLLDSGSSKVQVLVIIQWEIFSNTQWDCTQIPLFR